MDAKTLTGKPYRKAVSQAVDTTLDMLASEQWAQRKAYGVRPMDFDGVELMAYDQLYDSKRDVFNTDMWFPDLPSRLDYAILTLDPDSPKPMLVRMRQVTPKDVRGQIIMPMPLMVQLYLAWEQKKSTDMFGQRCVVGRAPSGKWVSLIPTAKSYPSDYRKDGLDPNNPGPLIEDSMVSVLIAAQFNAAHRWRVYLAKADGASVCIPTDPLGAQSVFKLRDIPEGASRRVALSHWVEEHWMQSRSDPVIEHKVRTYMAGQTEFTWNGLRCKIVPSVVDGFIEQVAKEERDAIRGTWADKKIEGEEPDYERAWFVKVLLWLRDKASLR